MQVSKIIAGVRSSDEHDTHRDRFYVLFLAGMMIIAAVVRFYGLGVRSLWIDEGFSWGVTQLPLREFLPALTTRAAEMSVYYMVLKLWSALGTSEFMLRTLSVIFSVLTVPIVAEVGKRIGNRGIGMTAAALFTFHVFVIRYAQEVRSYSLVMFLGALGWLQLTRIIRNPTLSNWLLFGLISILEVYSHLISGLNVAAQLLTLGFMPPLQLNSKAMLRGMAVTAFGLIPAVLYVHSHHDDLGWVQPLNWTTIRGFLDSVAGQQGSRIYLAFVGSLFALMCWLFFRSLFEKGKHFETWRRAVPVIGFAFPLLAIMIISLYRPVFVSRYLLFTTLPLIWGISELCWQFGSKWSLVTALVAVTTVAAQVPAYYRDTTFRPFRFQDFRGAVDYIARYQSSDDGLVVFDPIARPAVQYYSSKLTAFPEFLYPDRGRQFQPADMALYPTPQDLSSLTSDHDCVWVIYTATIDEKAGVVARSNLEHYFGVNFKLARQQHVYGLWVVEYSKDMVQ